MQTGLTWIIGPMTGVCGGAMSLDREGWEDREDLNRSVLSLNSN